MNEKLINVYFGVDNLPYKDTERQVHFPIVGGAFLGASNTTKIRFYYDYIGDSSSTWVSVAKLPNGKQGSQVLSKSSDDNGNYAELELSNWYTQAKGDVYIALQGYQGGVEYSYDDDTGLYEITGTPTIQTTGSIKLAINYAPIGDYADYNDEFTDYQRILAGLGDKADISSTIIVVDDITQVVAANYENKQIFYNLADRKLYQLDNSSFVVFQPYVVVSGEPIPESDFAIISAHKEYPILYSGYVYWYYGEDTSVLSYVRNDLNVSSNAFTTTKQIIIIFKSTRNYDVYTENAETYKKSKIDTELSGKADKSTTYTKTETDTLLNGKQNLLVNQQNIKSINGESLLGSGNIEIQGGSGGGAWGEITGDIQDQTDLQNEFQNVREIAEGKNKTLVIRYDTTAPTSDVGATMFKKADGTVFTNLADFNSYVSGLTLANPSFNTQDNLLLSNYYIISDDFIVYTDSYIHSNFKVGDIILIIQTDVPDRWFSFIYSAGAMLSKLETTKVDLTNYATKDDLDDTVNDIVANGYDDTLTYTKGEVVEYGGKIYRAKQDISTAEAWDSTHWEQINVASDFVNLTGAQTVDGAKTFTNDLLLESTGSNTPILTFKNQYATGELRMSAYNFTISHNLIPKNGTTPDLGTASFPWKDGWFSNRLYVKSRDDYKWCFYTTSGGANLGLGYTTANGNLQERYVLGNTSLTPYSNNSIDIGASNSRWKRAYIGNGIDLADSSSNILNHSTNTTYGLTLPDTTNFTANKEIGLAEGTYNFIDGDTLGVSTLTQAQYDTITNGRPTIITWSTGNIRKAEINVGSITSNNLYYCATCHIVNMYGGHIYTALRIHISDLVYSFNTDGGIYFNYQGQNAEFRNVSKINANTSGYGFSFPSSTSLTANSELVDSTSDQTITGAKTFGSGLTVGKSNTDTKLAVIGRYGTNYIYTGTSNQLCFDNLNQPQNAAYINTSEVYIGDNRNLKIKANKTLTDGTNSITVADIVNGTFNVINATDITNNAFNSDQLAIIGNGKPTMIIGDITISGNIYTNMLITSIKELYGNYYAVATACGSSANTQIASLYISGTNGTIQQNNQAQGLSLRNVANINGTAVSNFAQKGQTLVASGTFSNGEFSIDLTQTTLSDGMYFFTYGNAQAFVYISSSMLASANDPIRTAMPVIYGVNGETSMGTLKLTPVYTGSDLTSITVRVSVSNTTYAKDTFTCYVYKTNLA